MQIALRSYADSGKFPLQPRPNDDLSPSVWTLVFDTETTTTSDQRCRFGCYQIRKGPRLYEAGVFYDSEALAPGDLQVLDRVAKAEGMAMKTLPDFIETVFFRFGYDREGTIVGLNLPFDLSRLAHRHASARGPAMLGGFSFVLSPHAWRPRIQIKHLSSRAALIRFTKPGKQRRGRGMRRRGISVPAHRGYFVDLRTLAAALTSQPHSLASLGEYLAVKHPKLEAGEHGGAVGEDYVHYAIRDVQCSWECYEELSRRYHACGLTETPLHSIKSEASLGKGYLRQMGIRPWREMQPNCPPEMLGIILSTYFGGRSEVHLRRTIHRVLYFDFLSMYPTVSTLSRTSRNQ